MGQEEVTGKQQNRKKHSENKGKGRATQQGETNKKQE